MLGTLVVLHYQNTHAFIGHLDLNIGKKQAYSWYKYSNSRHALNIGVKEAY
jgi:hypothetical protein